MTLLSYHCHSLTPSGVSCVGVIKESHISFHTWPSEGVITLDLFSCGDDPLLPVIATIVRLFGIGDKHNIKTQWSHELRGFRPDEEKKKNYLADSNDLSLWVLSPLEMFSKKEIYGGLTKFQRVDIWDVVEVQLVVLLKVNGAKSIVLSLSFLINPILRQPLRQHSRTF